MKRAGPDFLRRFSEAPEIAALQSRRGPETIDGVIGSSFALLARALSKEGMVLCISETEDGAQDLSADLSAFDPDLAVVHVPGWSPGPGVPRSPTIELLGERIVGLSRLATELPDIVVTTREGLRVRTIPPNALELATKSVSAADVIEPQCLLEALLEMGFERVPTVQELGQVAMRGGIIDVFSFGRRRPVRIEFWGEEIESIREFEVHDQRSTASLPEVRILPRREWLVSQEQQDAAVTSLEAEGQGDDASRIRIDPYAEGYETLHRHFRFATGSIADYLPQTGCVIEGEDQGDPVPHGLDVGTHEDKLAAWRRIERSDLGRGSVVTRLEMEEPTTGEATTEGLLRAVGSLEDRGFEVILACENETQRRRYEEVLASTGAAPWVGALSAGFVFPGARLAILTDHEVFRRLRTPRRERSFEQGTHLANPFSLVPGDLVVHIDHGIGRFEKMERLTVDGLNTDCLSIDYHAGDRLFVPVDQLRKIQKHGELEEGAAAPRLDRLGGRGWERILNKTRAAIREMAGDLLRLYAERSRVKGRSYRGDPAWQAEFESAFPHEETLDQAAACAAVAEDLAADRPMDRLVCGDVGFGKTEVAIRGAFRVVTEGKQVAVLVPTTLLAEQHRETFSERFAGYPVEIRALSRFRKKKERDEILAGLANGQVDIVIGTHRLLSKDVSFADLGLIVIDEEHRFGVRQKEKLKKMRIHADVLSMTATPIPRTLHMALSGIRDLSVIATPPKNRFPIATEVLEFSEEVIAEAIGRELNRGGQVFFVYNRIRGLSGLAEIVERQVPGVRLGIAHGQMNERQLESITHQFFRGDLDVLVSTMIVESGLDLPNVNTLIVHRADRLGLAQLHQLRGRVGRGARRATALFLVPRRARLSVESRQRLRAVRDHTELGAGYSLAMRDMEIRGAGDILGGQQHGFIRSVGYETYCRLLDEVVRELKGEDLLEEQEVKLHIEADAYIPSDYVEDGVERFTLYKRLSRCRDEGSMVSLLEESRDRFGRPPDVAGNLFALKRLEIRSREIGLEDVVANRAYVRALWPEGKMPDRSIVAAVSVAFEGAVHFSSGTNFMVKIEHGKETALDGAQKVIEVMVAAGRPTESPELQ